MTYFRYEAKNLFGHKHAQRSHILRMALFAAMGIKALQGQPPLLKDTLTRTLRGSISFYPNEAFMPKAPRINVTFIDRDEHEGLSARAVLEVEYTAFTHRRAPLEIDVVFPDRLLGLARILGAEDAGRYTSLYFNLTEGELSGNLFDPIASICAAFDLTEASYEQPGAQPVLDGDAPGRFPPTYQALHERVR